MKAIRSLIDRLLKLTKGKSRFYRAHQRLSCAIWVKLDFVDRGFRIPGLVDEMSEGGMRFRPALSHICVRSGDMVIAWVGDAVIEAVIVNTTEQGYGLRLKQPLSSEDVWLLCQSSTETQIAA
jgi:hypothetical protein